MSLNRKLGELAATLPGHPSCGLSWLEVSSWPASGAFLILFFEDIEIGAEK